MLFYDSPFTSAQRGKCTATSSEPQAFKIYCKTTFESPFACTKLSAVQAPLSFFLEEIYSLFGREKKTSQVFFMVCIGKCVCVCSTNTRKTCMLLILPPSPGSMCSFPSVVLPTSTLVQAVEISFTLVTFCVKKYCRISTYVLIRSTSFPYSFSFLITYIPLPFIIIKNITYFSKN